MMKGTRVYCRVLQKEEEGLSAPPFPGKVGEEIQAHVSKQAWEIWLQQQTMLINEHRLDLARKKDRRWLFELMKDFLLRTSSPDQEQPSCV